MPASVTRHPPTKRIAVAELMRESDLTAEAIAVKTGVPYATVCRWNQFHNWRPWFRRTPPAVDPRRWSKPRLAALERVYREPGVEPGDLAQAVGTDRNRARAFFRECGFDERPAPPPEGESDGEGVDLRRSLRRHIARLIADLDADLTRHRGSPADTARMLRDLAGLKKLVDDLDAGGGAEPARESSLPEDHAAALGVSRMRMWYTFVAHAFRQLGDRTASDEEVAALAGTIFVERMQMGVEPFIPRSPQEAQDAIAQMACRVTRFD